MGEPVLPDLDAHIAYNDGYSEAVRQGVSHGHCEFRGACAVAQAQHARTLAWVRGRIVAVDMYPSARADLLAALEAP